MTVLDFIELDSEFLDYRTVQRLWGEDAAISVSVENEDPKNRLGKEQKSLRGVMRPLGAKLKIVEENRAAINSVIMSAGIEGFSEADLKTLTFSWLLFVFSRYGKQRAVYLFRPRLRRA